MNNLVLITSIIYTPNIPLSYINTRSIYSPTERFEQTKLTIKSVQEKIPNSKIILIECSEFNEEKNNLYMLQYLRENTDYFINLYDNENIRNNIYSKSKSLCEGSMTIYILDYIIKNNIKFDNLIKISGRYWLSDKFNYLRDFDNNNIVIKNIDSHLVNVFTALYKLPYSYVNLFLDYLIKNMQKMFYYIGYENLFANFLNQLCEIDIQRNQAIIKIIENIGLQGYVSVSGEFYDG